MADKCSAKPAGKPNPTTIYSFSNCLRVSICTPAWKETMLSIGFAVKESKLVKTQAKRVDVQFNLQQGWQLYCKI